MPNTTIRGRESEPTGIDPASLLINARAFASPVGQSVSQTERLANLGILAASMAHEIKNALVALKTFNDILFEKNVEPELAALARTELGRIDAIVGRMLNFSSPVRTDSTVTVHQTLQRSLRLLQPGLDRQNIVLQCHFGAALDTIRGDEDQLQQAFMNLLLNAIEAVGQDGTLTVATANPPSASNPDTTRANSHPNHVLVTIQDSGPGIPPEHVARVFEPFFTTKPGGTGLGLVITRRIVQEHRGEVTVRSVPGSGAIFQIRFPTASVLGVRAAGVDQWTGDSAK